MKPSRGYCRMAIDTVTPKCLYRAGGHIPGDCEIAQKVGSAPVPPSGLVVAAPHFNDTGMKPSCEVCALVSGPEETLRRRWKDQKKAWWTSRIDISDLYGQNTQGWLISFKFDEKPDAHGEIVFTVFGSGEPRKPGKTEGRALRRVLAQHAEIVFWFPIGLAGKLVYSA